MSLGYTSGCHLLRQEAGEGRIQDTLTVLRTRRPHYSLRSAIDTAYSLGCNVDCSVGVYGSNDSMQACVRRAVRIGGMM